MTDLLYLILRILAAAALIGLFFLWVRMSLDWFCRKEKDYLLEGIYSNRYLWLVIAVILGIATSFIYYFLVVRKKKITISRNLEYGVYSVVTVYFVLIGVWFAGKALDYYPMRADLTENKVYSLSGQTKNVIKELKTDVKATAFVRKLGSEAKYIEYMLTEMGRYSKRFKFEIIDIDIDPAKWQKYMIGEANTVVFEAGETPSDASAGPQNENIGPAARSAAYKRKDVKQQDIFQSDDPYNPQKIEPKGEQAFINAVYSLTEDKQRIVYFSEGHRELSIGQGDRNGLTELAKYLKTENYYIKTVKIATEGMVPEDCDLLIVAGPLNPFFDKEAEAVKNYLKNGGKAFFMLNPDLPCGLEKTLEYWNIKLEKGVVLDKRAFFQPILPIPSYKIHPITSPLDKDQVPLILPYSRGISDLKAKLDPRVVSRDDLLMTSESGWAAAEIKNGEKPVFKEGRDVKGPLALAVAVSEFVKADPKKTPASAESKETQFVVVGSSFFISNQWLTRSKGNLDFFINAANWMLKQENKISIRPAADDMKRLEITPTRTNIMFLVVVVLVPLAIVGSGIFVWFKRRSK